MLAIVTMLPAEFTVTEPPELLARLNKLAERFSSAVSRQPRPFWPEWGNSEISAGPSRSR